MSFFGGDDWFALKAQPMAPPEKSKPPQTHCLLYRYQRHLNNQVLNTCTKIDKKSVTLLLKSGKNAK